MLLATQGFQEKRVLHRRSHYSYIFFFHFPEHVTPQTIFLAEVSKYLPTLHPNLLHHSFPLSCFAAMKLSSRSFSSSQALTAGSVLCLLIDVHIYATATSTPSISPWALLAAQLLSLTPFFQAATLIHFSNSLEVQ